ncbi:MAG: AAA family ATPase [Gammaproteobacteria bacterium]|nr:AAA family ATPase [Gammaproteobacteria bacterium]
MTQPQSNQAPQIIQPDFKQHHVYSQEAEEALIGALLNDPSRLDSIKFLEPDDFFLLPMRQIYRAMLKAQEDGAITVVSVIEVLRQRRELESVGGMAQLTLLIRQCETSVYAELYARIIQRTAARRKLMALSQQLYKAAQNESIDTDSIVADYQDQMQVIAAPLAAQRGLTAGEAVARHMDNVDAAMQGEAINPVATGIADLDTILGGGFYPRRMICLAGINHHGKTSLMLTFALHALNQGRHVAYMNVADGNENDVMDRLLAMAADISPLSLQSGTLSAQDYSQYVAASGSISKLPFYIASKKGMTMPEIFGHCASFKSTRRNQLDLVCIDYMQRIGTVGRYTNDYERLNNVSQNLTRLAEKLNCPVIVAAQINRGVMKRQDKRPSRADIKGSGNIEEDADIVMITYIDDCFSMPGHDPVAMRPVEVLIDKNKVTGQRGIVHLLQNATSTKMVMTTNREENNHE